MRIFARVMKRFSVLLVSALAGLSACSPRDGEHTLQILATNDVHGSWFDQNYVSSRKKTSLLSVNTYIDSIRTASGKDNVLLIDSGDCLQGDNAPYYFNYVDSVSDHLFPRIVSYMGYDAVVVGNHDIETGPKVYDRVTEELAEKGIPFLAGNALKEDGKPYFPEYKVFKRAGLKVLVLGYTNPNMQAWLDKSLWPDVEFVSLIPFVQERVDEIKAKVKPDVTIVSVHSGTGPGDGSVLEAQGFDLFKSLKGVDVLLCSHDHAPHVKQGDGICLVNTGSRAKHLGQVTLTLTYKGGKLVSKTQVAGLIDIDPSKVDVKMKEAFASDYEKVKAFTLKPVGSIAEDMYTRDAFTGPSFYMNLIHKVQLAKSGVDVSFSAPLTSNGRLAKGELVFNDMFTLYPYENSLCVLSLSGKEIRDYLEYSYSHWVKTYDGKGVLNISERSSERYGTRRWSFDAPSFNFDSAAGIKYTVDVTKPYGERVKIQSFSDGTPFDMGKMYKVAMTSYRAAGGGDLLFKGAGLSRADLEERTLARYPEIREMLYQYILENKEISASSVSDAGDWKFIPEKVCRKALARDMKLLFE